MAPCRRAESVPVVPFGVDETDFAAGALVDFGEQFARTFEGGDEGGAVGYVDCFRVGGGGGGVRGWDGGVGEGAFVDAEVCGGEGREGLLAAWSKCNCRNEWG